MSAANIFVISIPFGINGNRHLMFNGLHLLMKSDQADFIILKAVLENHKQIISESEHNSIIFAGLVVARGCATKRPLFHIECENHESLTKSEEFCYCSYNLCNSKPAISLSCAIYILLCVNTFLRFSQN